MTTREHMYTDHGWDRDLEYTELDLEVEHDAEHDDRFPTRGLPVNHTHI
jgi:hypothetical protein